MCDELKAKGLAVKDKYSDEVDDLAYLALEVAQLSKNLVEDVKQQTPLIYPPESLRFTIDPDEPSSQSSSSAESQEALADEKAEEEKEKEEKEEESHEVLCSNRRRSTAEADVEIATQNLKRPRIQDSSSDDQEP